MDGYFVWDGCILPNPDKRFHLYGSYWPEKLGMNGLLTDSKIIHAFADDLTDPFSFKEELTCLNEQSWNAY